MVNSKISPLQCPTCCNRLRVTQSSALVIPAQLHGLTELGLGSLEKKKLPREPWSPFQYLKGATRETKKGSLQPAVTGQGGMAVNGKRFRLNVRNKCFTIGLMRHWNRLLQKVIEAPSLETSKACFGGALSTLVEGVPAHGMVGLDDL